MEKKIIIEDREVLTLKLCTKDGKETGEVLEFDLEDISLPFKLQELIDRDKKNKIWLKNKISIIEKQKDVKNKKMMSKNEEERLRAITSFFNKQVEIYDLFLGDGGVSKILNGRKFGWTTLQEIDDIIQNQIAPYLEKSADEVAEKIKDKYKNFLSDEQSVLK